MAARSHRWRSVAGDASTASPASTPAGWTAPDVIHGSTSSITDESGDVYQLQLQGGDLLWWLDTVTLDG
jgi:hypothetical protein